MVKGQRRVLNSLSKLILDNITEDVCTMVSGEYSEAYITKEKDKYTLYHKDYSSTSTIWERGAIPKEGGVREIASFLTREYNKLGFYPIIMRDKKEVINCQK